MPEEIVYIMKTDEREVSYMKKKIITAVLMAAMLLSGCTAGNNTVKVTEPIVKPTFKTEYTPINYSALSNEQYDEKAMEEEYMKFVFEFFSKTAAKSETGNMMVSPASLMFALDLAAAGAGGDTLKQIAEAVGSGEDPEKTLKFASDLMNKINSSEGVSFKAANAEWFNSARYGDNVNKDYLNYVKEMYGAEVNFSEFNDKTLKEINDWTSDHTNKMIPEIIKELDPNYAAVLVNAMAFDGKWEKEYEDAPEAVFHGSAGDKNTPFLFGSERAYFETGEAIGFRKNYKGGQYSFVTMLPKDSNVNIKDFASKLSYDKYKEFIGSQTNIEVWTQMPEFKSDYEVNPMEVLSELGIKDAFNSDAADFRGIADTGLYIQKIIHKTAIEVNKGGTKASAATAVMMTEGAVMEPEEHKEVYLNRPFVYAIVDNATDMPVFIGSIENV